MIDKFKELIRKYKQFVLFCLVGASNTLITLFVLWLLNTKLGINYLLASTIGYVCGILNGYLWSTKVVFRKKRTTGNAAKFIVVNLLAIGLNMLLMYVWVDLLDIMELPAQIITTAFTMVLNFALNKLWTFRDKNTEQTP